MANLKFIKRIEYSDINSIVGDTAFFYEAGMAIDADGGYRAYHPLGGPGLDYLGNGGKPGNWWALVTDTGKPSGSPEIQGSSDPAPGYYISTTALEDTSRNRKDPRRYVDSESINYFVLPGKSNLGASLGDFGVVIRPETGAYEYAIYADAGPSGKIGEGSISLAKSLGIPSSPKNGGTGHGIVYIVFPGSGKGWPLSEAEIDQSGSAAFAKWGGIGRAKEVFPYLVWA